MTNSFAGHRRVQPLRLIAAFKLLKAAALLASLATVLDLVHHDDPVHTMITWAMHLHVDPDNTYLRLLLARLIDLHGDPLLALVGGILLYAMSFVVEGVGLLFDKVWAEYLTLFETAGFVPLEIYEIAQRASVMKGLVLLLNLGVVLYLLRRLRLNRARRL